MLRFRLIYDGPLPADQRGRSLSDVKSNIRRQFDPQLRELWRTHKDLKALLAQDSKVLYKGGYHAIGAAAIANEYRVGDLPCVPLVRKTNGMLCTLDILLLVRQAPFHSTFASGDLDNRVKTLIDGLRRPTHPQEHSGSTTDTLFCLLEDDDLITEFQVRCDQLLAPTRSDQDDRDVVAIISVQVLNTDSNILLLGSSPFALEKAE